MDKNQNPKIGQSSKININSELAPLPCEDEIKRKLIISLKKNQGNFSKACQYAGVSLDVGFGIKNKFFREFKELTDSYLDLLEELYYKSTLGLGLPPEYENFKPAQALKILQAQRSTTWKTVGTKPEFKMPSNGLAAARTDQYLKSIPGGKK